MNARLKLNSSAIHGALIIGGLIGWAFGSWLAFLIAAGAILATAFHSGEIRTTSVPTRASRSAPHKGPKVRSLQRRRR